MDEEDPTEINLRASGYFLASASMRCPHCGGETEVTALALPAGHESLADDDEYEKADWNQAPHPALLFHVEVIPETVQLKVRALCPDFKFAHSARSQSAYWANHCSRCKRLLEDHELFCEADGAFCPVRPEDALRIRLTAVHEPIVAAAGGLADDPHLFDAVSE